MFRSQCPATASGARFRRRPAFHHLPCPPSHWGGGAPRRAVQLLALMCLALWLGSASAQQPDAPPPPPVPPNTNLPVRVIPPTSRNVVVTKSPAAPTARRTPPGTPTVPAAYRPMAEGLLAWDHETKETTIPFGTPTAQFTFALTNISTNAVVINSVRTSCGCTTPKMPPLPWTLQSKDKGQIDVTMRVAGKRGTVVKTVTVTTDQGFKTLYVRTVIEDPVPGAMGAQDRMKNLRIATANRQAVFQGDCATCHVTPALNKTGAALYQTACGICHEAEHRASMVPDLANLQKETNADFWRTWITSSADGKLMPAFALENGGFLNAMQIESLVNYLVGEFPKNRQPATPAEPMSTHPPTSP